jgi:hypothetical protein
MRFPVDLDDQHPRDSAGEIRDVAIDHDLPAKLRAIEAPRSQRIPEPSFGSRHFTAHFLGSFDEVLVSQ